MSSPPATRGAVTVLCIDDNRFGVEIRKLSLEAHGFTVLTASSGQAGLAMLGMFGADVVLLDYKMDGMNGDLVAWQIRRKHPALPIVLLSGYPSDIPAPLLRLVDAFVVKGQPPQVLFNALEAVTRMLPKKEPLMDLGKTLGDSERLVKLGRQIITGNKRELNARRRAG